MKTFVFSLVALCLTASPSFACFTCAPDTFTLKDKEGGYHLSGAIETPTPGYSYALEKTGDAWTLRLTPPDGMVIQVIDRLEIEHSFAKEEVGESLTINFDKTYNWGDTAVQCRRMKH